MKSLTVIECRKCSQQWYNGDENIILEPNDALEILLRIIPKCSECKSPPLRSRQTGKKVQW